MGKWLLSVNSSIYTRRASPAMVDCRRVNHKSHRGSLGLAANFALNDPKEFRNHPGCIQQYPATILIYPQNPRCGRGLMTPSTSIH